MLKLLSKLSLIAIFATAILGCSSLEKSEGNAIYMSAILPFNDSPESAKEMYNAMKMAVDEVNASKNRLAGKELKLDIRSDGEDIYETNQVIQSMLDSNIDILHIAVRAPIIFKQEALAQSSKFINYMNEYAPATLIAKNSVRIFLSAVQTCETLAGSLSKEFSQIDDSKVFILCLDDLVSRSNAEYLKYEISKPNAKDIFFKKGETSFELFAEHIEGLGIEYVFIVSLGEENYEILKALKKFNYEGKVLSFSPTKGESPASVNEPSDALGYFCALPAFDIPNAKNQGESSIFKDKYYALFGTAPSHKAAYAYDSIILSAKAYNNSPKNMRDSFLAKSFEAAIGSIEFDITGDSKVKMSTTYKSPLDFKGCVLAIVPAEE